MAERPEPSSRATEASHRAQRFREAYEALIEPLINATIKLAEAENALAAKELERKLLSEELQAISESRSWRLTEPLRRAASAMRQLQLAASTFFARCCRQAKHSISRFFIHSRDCIAAALERAWISSRKVVGGRLLRWLARLGGSWRLSWSRPRTLWGVTPILTLPLLAKCDRLLGFRSESLVFTVYHTTDSFDINLKAICDAVYHRFPRWMDGFHKAVLHLALIRYDVFHTFCDRGLLPATQGLRIEVAELEAIRNHGRRLYAYTYGADVRTRQATLALGRYNLCAECPEPGRFCTCDDEQGARNIETIRRHATALVSMGDMLAYTPEAWNIHYWPIDTAKFQNVNVDWQPNRRLRVGHAPNHAHFKGTRFLVGAIEHLQARGYAIELVSRTGVANSEVISLLKSCDVVADQFIAGFHGYTALEAMALGKPVLCYLRSPEAAIDPATCPIINCSPDAIEEALKTCLDGGFNLTELGRRSRSYVEHYYSIEAIAIRLGKLYLQTAAFPDRVNRMISLRICELEARLPPLLPGDPPIPWHFAGDMDRGQQRPAVVTAR
jgi:hypothetical protein